MNPRKRIRICIIGAGNVATHMAAALNNVADIAQICSRNPAHASELAAKLGPDTEGATLDALRPDADIYIIAANDDSIAAIAESTPPYPGIWAHTSGSVPVSVFAGLKSRFGSFYPLQTFSKGVPVEFDKVPMFIEGSDDSVRDELLSLAKQVSSAVETADSERRKALHLAAVFACNFANLMWLDADTLMRHEGLTVNHLTPLLEVTLQKLRDASPKEAMTGPARRGDLAVLRAQHAALPDNLKATYALLSQRILDIYHPSLQFPADN
ncbi:MAG: DUF2520 domain-containing protein [Muribaculaceae bacterium]|nr:DUF2520 domain-containing protein [Muribaculaceae bacterium]